MKRALLRRREFWLGSAGLVSGAAFAGRAAADSTLEYAVFTEFSPESKKMKPGWNRRIFTNTDVRKGSGILYDSISGVVTLAPGTYQVSGFSMVAYFTGDEPPETTTIRAPASAGYCRLRRVAANAAADPIGLHDIDNGDPSVLCIGSAATANLEPSLFETFCTADSPARIVLEHQAGTKPEQIYLRVFAQASKWHAMARVNIRRLQ